MMRSIDPFIFSRGKKIYEPPRFMTVAQAADQLMQIIHRRRGEGEGEKLGECHRSPLKLHLLQERDHRSPVSHHSCVPPEDFTAKAPVQ